MDEIKKYETINKFLLSDEEYTYISEHIERYIESFEELTKYDMLGTEPLVSVLINTNVFREDIPYQPVDPKTLLSSAHSDNEEYFEIPGILF